MSAVTLVLIAAVLGLLLGTALIPGAPIFALPIVVILIVVLGLTEFRRRQEQGESLKGVRDDAKAEEIEFTARDRQTLAD